MKPHLFLLPGALGTSTLFRHLAEVLQAHYHIHTPDYSGHGGTPMGPHAFTIAGCAEDLTDRINRWCADGAPVYVAGHSLGGYTALFAALQPDHRISGVMTVGTKFAWTPAFAEGETKMLQPELLLQKVPDFARDLQQRHAPADGSDPERWKLLLAATAGMMQELGQHPPLTEATLAHIQIPVKICVGDRDRMVGIDESMQAWKWIPGAQFCVMPDSPHPIERVSTKRLAFEIQEFFKA